MCFKVSSAKWRPFCLGLNVLNWFYSSTPCGPVTPYDVIEHWFGCWLLAQQHQTITLFNVDLSSMKSCGITRGQFPKKCSNFDISYECENYKIWNQLMWISLSSELAPRSSYYKITINYCWQWVTSFDNHVILSMRWSSTKECLISLSIFSLVSAVFIANGIFFGIH